MVCINHLLDLICQIEAEIHGKQWGKRMALKLFRTLHCMMELKFIYKIVHLQFWNSDVKNSSSKEGHIRIWSIELKEKQQKMKLDVYRKDLEDLEDQFTYGRLQSSEWCLLPR